MGLKFLCKHNNYDVTKWCYVNRGKFDEHIKAMIVCKNCGKTMEKIIDQELCNAFATIYDEKFEVY